MSELENFERIMRAHGPKIYTLAVRLCGGNVSEGDDLAQEAFVKAWEHWSQFQGESEVSTWLYRICVNTWKNKVRYEKRRLFFKHFSLSAGSRVDEEAPLDLPSNEKPLDSGLEQSEMERNAQQALMRLDPEDRAIIVMREMDEKSYEEIAEALELPIGTVRSRLSRAREKLTQEFSRITL